ncbi:FAD/NAD(P)-binding protein [Agrobacterium sp. 22-209-1]
MAENGIADNPLLFALRGDYGLYLRDRLAGLLRNREQRARVDFVAAKASACRPDGTGGFSFTLENGEQLHAQNVVLCLGVGAASLPVQTVAREEEGATTYHRPLLAAGMVVQNQSRGSYLHSGVGPDDDRSGFDSEGKKTSRVDPCSVPSRPGVASACQPAVTVSRAEFT